MSSKLGSLLPRLLRPQAYKIKFTFYRKLTNHNEGLTEGNLHFLIARHRLQFFQSHLLGCWRRTKQFYLFSLKLQMTHQRDGGALNKYGDPIASRFFGGPSSSQLHINVLDMLAVMCWQHAIRKLSWGVRARINILYRRKTNDNVTCHKGCACVWELFFPFWLFALFPPELLGESK